MSAFEEIEAAIARLKTLRDDGKPGPWTFTWGSATIPAADDLGEEDAELILTLHRTIDAQLEILQGARTVYWREEFRSVWQEPIAKHAESAALGLARAINGAAQ